MARCACCGARCCARTGVAPPAGAAAKLDDELARVERAGFSVKRVLGIGGFGAVIEAVPEGGTASVAIKIARSRPLAEARLLREAEALAAIGPPHVPAVHGVHWIDDAPLLVMDLVTAPTLATRLAARPGPLPLAAVRWLAAAILRAVGAAHARGYAHCDLKPENILVGDDAPACLVDFGLARRGDGAGLEITSEGTILGTPEYMAPEQCRGRDDVDPRADIYALGVILFEMLVGRAPFWGSAADVQWSHRTRRPTRPSDAAPLPAEVDEVVLRCLAKEPADRFQRVADLAEALDDAVRATVTTVRPPPLSTMRLDSEPPERERRTVAVLFFTTEAELSRVQEVLAPLGGQLAHAGGARLAAVFDHGAADNPARLAVAAAREVIASGICTSARVDLLPVSVQRRSNGARRYQSPLFACADRYPGPGDPAAVLASREAAEILGDQRWIALAGRSDVVQLDVAGAAEAEAEDTPFVGRDETLDRLVAAAHLAVAGRCPTLVTVIAEPGLGKTRLARALHARLGEQLPKAAIVSLRGRDPADGGPLSTLHDLLQFALDPPATAPPAGLRAAGALRAALARAAGEALRTRAAARPVLVLLDDAHLADEATLDALEHATHAEASLPIFACALARPIFESARPGWGERAAAREELRLAPLAPEILRDLARERTADQPLLEWIAQREIDALSPDLAALARLAALLGPEVSVAEIDGVVRVLEQHGEAQDLRLDPRVGVRRLVASGVLVARPDGRVGFRHALAREAIARAVSPALRVRVERAASDYRHESRDGEPV